MLYRLISRNCFRRDFILHDSEVSQLGDAIKRSPENESLTFTGYFYSIDTIDLRKPFIISDSFYNDFQIYTLFTVVSKKDLEDGHDVEAEQNETPKDSFVQKQLHLKAGGGLKWSVSNF